MADDMVSILAEARIVPVLVIDDAARAPELIAALLSGGLTAAEITLRTDAALAALAAVSRISGFRIGTGTALTRDDVSRSVDAGASFVVSPGLAEDVVERAHELGVAVLPGVATASEVLRATRLGLEAVKFFPADHLGGLAAIRALAAPLAGIRFMPSGGVTLQNAEAYLAEPAVVAVSGSWTAPRAAIARGEFEEIAQLSAEARALVGGIALNQARSRSVVIPQSTPPPP